MHGAVHGDGNVVRLGRGQCVELFMAMATLCDLAEVSVWSYSWQWQRCATWPRSVCGVVHGDGNVVRPGRGQCVELFMAMATSCELAEAKTVCPTGGHSSERMASWMTL